MAACLDPGGYYVDIAETPAFIAAARRAARNSNSAHAVSGCSTVPSLVQVLAQHWGGRDDVFEVKVFLGMGSANPVSPALLFSFLRPLGIRVPDGTTYFNRLTAKHHRGTAARLYGRYPSPFDGDALRIGGRLAPAVFHAGMDRPALGRALWLAARVVPRMPSSLLKRCCRLTQLAMPFVRAQGTTLGILALDALDHRGRIVQQIEVRAREQGLDVPALPSVWAVRCLLERGADLPAGVLSLDQMFTQPEVAGWLEKEGYQVSGVRK